MYSVLRQIPHREAMNRQRYDIKRLIGSSAPFCLTMVIALNISISFTQTITSFSPETGPAGTSVTINGSGFDNAPANNIVYFGATMATVSTATTTMLTAIVPPGANYQYITSTNLVTNLTAYSLKPFLYSEYCNSASTFAAAVTVQGGSHNVEIYDMDGDGLADLIIPDYFNNYFTVTRNTSTPGTISFAPKLTFAWAAGGQPNEVSIGDFDGDGKPDVALGGNGGGSFVSVYRNTSTPGSISFAARQDFTASSGQGNGNRIIDIDGDGKPDLLSVHWSGNCLWVLRNTSTGPGVISFAAGVSFATTTQPHKIDVGDLDGDGKPDVVITAFTSNKMSIFRNTSTVGTISFAARQDFSPGTVPYFVHLGDLDGDGKLDIALVNRDVATMAVYRNTSTVGTISLATKQDFATPAGTFTHYGVALGDIDGDGKLDAVAGNYTLNVTSIFRNTSTVGAISFATRVDLASGVSYDVGIDDFDQDGLPDIAVVNSGTTVAILRNQCLLLPIELTDFTGSQQGHAVKLEWTTASELNNDKIIIERSNNGDDFDAIGIISGAGTSEIEHDYQFLDQTPTAGLNYYRLKQIDFDGASEYSHMIVVDVSGEASLLTIFPNPTNGMCSIMNTADASEVMIINDLGEVVFTTTGNANITHINIGQLPAGMYTVVQITNGAYRSGKLIKY